MTWKRENISGYTLSMSRNRFLSNGSEEAAAVKMQNASRSDQGFFLAMLDSSLDGLTPAQAKERLLKFGPNQVHHEKAPTWYKQLGQAFINPFIGILIMIAILSFVMDIWFARPGEAEYKTIAMVGFMVFVSSLLRFIQEYRSNRAAEQLKSMVTTTATVLRKYNHKKEIDIKQLVPGDIIFLSAGDMVPADCRIIQSKDLFVSQAILTGESMPAEKRNLPIRDADDTPPIELDNICFRVLMWLAAQLQSL